MAEADIQMTSKLDISAQERSVTFPDLIRPHETMEKEEASLTVARHVSKPILQYLVKSRWRAHLNPRGPARMKHLHYRRSG
ncbi:hypothetical protein [Antarctobacter heliothermus]|uniref:hypothetical protein n=1 Tax=Antarctobacter heliothermus TaxID=74033 RepID=UPI0014832E95|nr:hypothetical protein [Antarctobacter heliothermus]